MIEKGNMTDAEYIAALISENKKLSFANNKLGTENEKLSVEVECLKRLSYLSRSFDTVQT